MTTKTMKKEYQPGGSNRQYILDKAVEYMYPIMGDVLGVALDYIPTKVLKRIVARFKK